MSKIINITISGGITLKKYSLKKNWIETTLILLLLLVTGLSIGWHIYRYGGNSYYMTINHNSIASYPVTVPVNITQNGYAYKEVAKDKYGNKKTIELKTVADDLGPFHKGQIIKVTYNKHFGVTNYKRIKSSQVPIRAKSND